jgi:hypothetical protein
MIHDDRELRGQEVKDGRHVTLEDHQHMALAERAWRYEGKRGGEVLDDRPVVAARQPLAEGTGVVHGRL